MTDYSGSGYENDTIKDAHPLWFLVIPMSPLICVVTVFVLSYIYYCTNYLKKYIFKQIKNKYLKYCGPDVIVNGKLSNKCIKQFNSMNQTDEIKNSTQECAICIDEITKKQKSVTLNCGHTFHKKCLQPWIKTQTTAYNDPTCPLDRTVIIEIPTVTYDQIIYSSDSDNSDFA